MTRNNLLIISGIPGTGKSEFSKWLVENYNFSYHEYDKCQENYSEGFFEKERAVIEWGFDSNEPGLSYCIGKIKFLIDDYGAQHWWFDGDRDAALESFSNRGTVKRSSWDRQLQGIEVNWKKISTFMSTRKLNVIKQGPSYLPSEQIFKAIFPSGL